MGLEGNEIVKDGKKVSKMGQKPEQDEKWDGIGFLWTKWDLKHDWIGV